METITIWKNIWKQYLFGGSHLYPRIAGKRGAGKRGWKKGLATHFQHTSNKYPIYPSGPAVAPVQQPDSYYPVSSCA